ncbi:YopT-type cysteine protease domain-containing protein [Falsiroseomonas sp. HW251]|uniref:YopT-type cysteine protease domain-containing protein n=1 Tax=Falsiroseomonas sp. HW251 TaxID=3390998 RepID=UPI003D317A79
MSFATLMKSIQADSLKNNGGYVHYSQSIEPTRTLINMLPYTSGGICNALSAKWIEQHANGGSLWNWLFTPGTTNVQQAKIANLMINFTESVVSGASDIDKSQGNHGMRQRIANRIVNKSAKKAFAGGDYQEFVTDKYLALYGIRRRRVAQDIISGSIENCLSYGYGPKTAIQLAVRMDPKYMVTRSGTYAIINILGKAGGHAMAAWVGEDVAFFDPNFGEFYFPKNADFQKFFPTFWRKSGYESSFDRFCFFLYAKAVN